MKTPRTLSTILAVALVAASDRASAQKLTTLHLFNGSDGSEPTASLVQGNDGNFYGTTTMGGATNAGTVFRISPTGIFTNLYSFTHGDDGALPLTGLVQGNDGNFYGTTSSGGTNNFGTVFRISPSGSFTTLYLFTSALVEPLPTALVQGSDSNFYGTTFNFPDIFRISPTGVFTDLHSFIGDGSHPRDIIQGSDGNFYGTTDYGGGSNNCPGGTGCGTVFRISPAGVFTNLYAFTGGGDGGLPNSLVQGSDSNFYGTTKSGGTASFGTVFQITPSGTLTTLHSFAGSPDDGGSGGNFSAGLVEGSDGYFYGTTESGGAISEPCDGGCGTVFRMSTNGTIVILHSFANGSDGAGPGGLVQGSDGAFYGTTSGRDQENGTVFKLIPGSPEGRDLAITKLTVPKTITLKAGRSSVTNRVTVSIQNRSTHPNDITDYNSLVTLVIASLGAQTCPPPTPVLISGAPNKPLPVTVKPGHRLNISFSVIYNCANDTAKGPGHEDFGYTATVHTEAIDGYPDTFPSDDDCPRGPQVGVSLGTDTITDKGCGRRDPSTGQFGAPILTDVLVK